MSGFQDDEEAGYEDFSMPILKGFKCLGYDIMWNICRYCIDVKSIVRLSMTCKTIRGQIIDEDEEVWRYVVLERDLVKPIEYARIASLMVSNNTGNAIEMNKNLTNAANFTTWRSVVKRVLSEKHYTFFKTLVQAAVEASRSAMELAQSNPTGGRAPVIALPEWEDAVSNRPTFGDSTARSSLKSIGNVNFTGGLCVGKSGAWVIASALKYAGALDTLKLPGQNLGNCGASLLALASAGGSERSFNANVRPWLTSEEDANTVQKKAKDKKGVAGGSASGPAQSYGTVLQEAMASAPTESRPFISVCFDLAKQQLDPLYVSRLGNGFGRTLTTLNLNENKIEGEAGGRAVANLLLQCPQLMAVSLCRNLIDAKGAKHIAAAVALLAGGVAAMKEEKKTSNKSEASEASVSYGFPQLSRLFFDGNAAVGDEGVAAIVESMAAMLAAQAASCTTTATTATVHNGEGSNNLFHKGQVSLLRRSQFILSFANCGLRRAPVAGLTALVEAHKQLVNCIESFDVFEARQKESERAAAVGKGGCHYATSLNDDDAGGSSSSLLRHPSVSVVIGNGLSSSPQFGEAAAGRNAFGPIDKENAIRLNFNSLNTASATSPPSTSLKPRGGYFFCVNCEGSDAGAEKSPLKEKGKKKGDDGCVVM